MALLGDISRSALEHDFEMTHIRSHNRKHPQSYGYAYGGYPAAAVYPAAYPAAVGGCYPCGGVGAAAIAAPVMAAAYPAAIGACAAPVAYSAAAYSPYSLGGYAQRTVPYIHGSSPLSINTSAYGTSIYDVTGMTPAPGFW